MFLLVFPELLLRLAWESGGKRNFIPRIRLRREWDTSNNRIIPCDRFMMDYSKIEYSVGKLKFLLSSDSDACGVTVMGTSTLLKFGTEVFSFVTVLELQFQLNNIVPTTIIDGNVTSGVK
jgi:hypothetical protein